MKKTVIIIHEIYGVTDPFLSLKDKLEMRGYTVLLPSLYDDDYRGDDEELSYKKFFADVGIEKGYRVIDSLIAQNSGSEIYLIGFSIGAAVAWLHSTGSIVKSIIGVYGSRIRDYTDLNPAVNTYLYFCEEKSFDIKPVVVKLQVKEKVKITMLSGSHGFYNSSERSDIILKSILEDEIFRIIEQ